MSVSDAQRAAESLRMEANALRRETEKVESRAADYSRSGDSAKALEQIELVGQYNEKITGLEQQALKRDQEAQEQRKQADEVDREITQLRQDTDSKIKELENQKSNLLGRWYQ